MIAFLGDGSVFEHDDALGHADRGETMGDEERHFAFRQLIKALKNLEFGARIGVGENVERVTGAARALRTMVAWLPSAR